MTTINDISDLARILQERPEWLSTIRGLILTEEVLRLPEMMAALTAAVEELARQTAEQIRVVNERLGRLETDVGVLKTDVDVLKTDVGILKTDVDVLKTDVAILKTDVAILKTDVDVLKTDVAILKTDVAGLKTEQARTNRRLGRIENQIGDLRGSILEITAARQIAPRVIQQMGLYHCDTLVGPAIPLAQDKINEIRQAELDGIVEPGSDQVRWADLVLHGRRSSDNRPVWVVVEASARIDEHDISRARHRADILAAVYREDAIAIVVGESIDDRDRIKASDAEVSVITLHPRYRNEEGDDEI